MQDVNPRRRLLGRMLIGAGALALPLTASISYAAQDAPDAPSAPAAPVAPTTPDAPKIERQVTIIEHRVHGDNHREIDESKLHTRTITRDGKTIIIKTDHEMSVVDLEARLARLDDLVPPVPPVPPVAGVAPLAPEDPRRIEHRLVIRRHGEGRGPGEIRILSDGGRVITCAPGGEVNTVDVRGAEDGNPQTVRIRMCHAAAAASARVSALEGIRRARASIAANTELSARIKADVLRELDGEIKNLSERD